MKKLFLTVAIALLSTVSYAQRATGSLTLQPKVGLNIANMTKTDGSVRAGLVAGAEFEYQVTDMISVSAGALYSQQGCKEDILTEAGSVSGTLKLDYINIPILANVYVTRGLAVKLGVQPGFKVNSSEKVSLNSTSVSGDVDDVKSFDFSIPVGLSYEYKNVVFDARYNIGCTKIVDYADSKHSVFQLTLGYKFDL